MKEPNFERRKRITAPDGETPGENRPFRPKHKRNELKLNQFHQRVRKDKKPTTMKKIRDINRLLQRSTLPEEVKTEKRKVLKDLKVEQRAKRKDRFMQLKYKNIRFVEQKKVIRKLNQVQKQIDSASGDTEELEARKQELVDDLHYIKHFPENKRYISLFAKNEADDEATLAKTREQIAQIKQEIRENVQITNEKKVDLGIKKSKAEKSDKPPRRHDDFFAESIQPDEEDGVVPEKPAKKFVNRKGIVCSSDFQPRFGRGGSNNTWRGGNRGSDPFFAQE